MACKKTRGKVQVTTEDLEKAGKIIIYNAQPKAFPNEFKEITKGREEKPLLKCKINTHSSICKLDPYIDEHGILHVGGGLKHADISEKVKLPVILPTASHMTNADMFTCMASIAIHLKTAISPMTDSLSRLIVHPAQPINYLNNAAIHC